MSHVGCDQYIMQKNRIYLLIYGITVCMLDIELVIAMSVRVQPHMYTSSHPGLYSYIYVGCCIIIMHNMYSICSIISTCVYTYVYETIIHNVTLPM